MLSRCTLAVKWQGTLKTIYLAHRIILKVLLIKSQNGRKARWARSRRNATRTSTISNFVKRSLSKYLRTGSSEDSIGSCRRSLPKSSLLHSYGQKLCQWSKVAFPCDMSFKSISHGENTWMLEANFLTERRSQRSTIFSSSMRNGKQTFVASTSWTLLITSGRSKWHSRALGSKGHSTMTQSTISLLMKCRIYTQRRLLCCWSRRVTRSYLRETQLKLSQRASTLSWAISCTLWRVTWRYRRSRLISVWTIDRKILSCSLPTVWWS